VKSKDEVARLMTLLFPGASLMQMAHNVDSKIGTLPGLEGIALMVPYSQSAPARVAATLQRATS
jgi:hypothetical protein